MFQQPAHSAPTTTGDRDSRRLPHWYIPCLAPADSTSQAQPLVTMLSKEFQALLRKASSLGRRATLTPHTFTLTTERRRSRSRQRSSEPGTCYVTRSKGRCLKKSKITEHHRATLLQNTLQPPDSWIVHSLSQAVALYFLSQMLSACFFTIISLHQVPSPLFHLKHTLSLPRLHQR